MPTIHDHGQWSRLPLPGHGALTIHATSAVPVVLEVSDPSVPLRRTGGQGDEVGLPLQSVPADGLRVSIVSRSGEPFAVDASIDLALVAGSEPLYVLRRIPVAGRVRADVVELRPENGESVLLPAAAGPTPRTGLGGWLIERQSAQNGPASAVMPTVTEVLVDSSVSMRAHEDRVERLTGLITQLCEASGAPAPTMRACAVGGGGAGQDVGAVEAPPAGQGRRIVLSDLPQAPGGAETLLVTDGGIMSVLTGDVSVLELGADAWEQIEREDAAYDAQTLQSLSPLLEWLSRPVPSAPADVPDGEPR